MDPVKGDMSDLKFQGTIQATFKAFFATLSAQGEAIRNLERSRDELALALRNDISAATQKKANTIETMARIAEVEAQLRDKADVSDMERRVLKTDADANMRMQMAEVLSLLTQKTNETDLRAWRDASEHRANNLLNEVSRIAVGLEKARAELSSKAGAGDTAVALAAKADTSTVEAQLREKVDRVLFTETLATKADVVSLSTLEDELKRQLETVQAALKLKAEAMEVEQGHKELEAMANQDRHAATEGLKSLASDVSAAFDQALGARTLEAREELADTASGLRDELYTAVADITERQDATLQSKADQSQVEKLYQKLEKSTSQALAGVSAKVVSLQILGADRQKTMEAGASELKREVAAMVSKLEELQATLGAKSNIEDVNTALAEVCQLTEAQRLAAPPGHPSSSTGLTGRWLWKTGQTLVGGVLPWSVQAVNTNPELLVWSPEHSTVITVLTPGLWNLTFGFFSRSRPAVVQIFLNGEPIITSQSTMKSTPLKVIPPSSHASGRSKAMEVTTTTQHSSGNVTGLTGSEFLSLPAGGARIAVTVADVDASERIEGFLQLQKI